MHAKNTCFTAYYYNIIRIILLQYYIITIFYSESDPCTESDLCTGKDHIMVPTHNISQQLVYPNYS